MNDRKIGSLEEVRAFLAGTAEIAFCIQGKDARYRWLEQTLRRLAYRSLKPTGSGAATPEFPANTAVIPRQ